MEQERTARSREHGAGSEEQRAKSKEYGARSKVKSKEHGAKSSFVTKIHQPPLDRPCLLYSLVIVINNIKEDSIWQKV
jgi:hypothetical protein